MRKLVVAAVAAALMVLPGVALAQQPIVIKFSHVVAPNTLWIKNLRTSVPYLFFMSFVVSVGMWLERFVIVVTSLSRDFLPSSWGMYYPTRWDFATFFGSIGLFLTLLFLFIRFLPMISIFEMRTILPEAEVEGHGGH
jgi:molybdopterin-containing oxidoreductase family membrane subunit